MTLIDWLNCVLLFLFAVVVCVTVVPFVIFFWFRAASAGIVVGQFRAVAGIKKGELK